MLRMPLALTGLLAAFALAAAAAPASVVLNEVNCEGTDWVELVNTGASAVDLSGWLLTDDPLDGTRPDHRLLLAGGTTLAGQAALVLEKGPAGFPFGIKCGEDTIRLADAGGTQVDAIAIPTLAAPADTWGRYPSGTGAWAPTTPTPGTPNVPSTAGGAPADAAAWLFDPGQVVEIDLGLADEARATLEAEPGEYVPGTFSLTTTGGTYGPYAVGVRLKGSVGSFRPLTGKAGFKVSFNHVVAGQRFLGLRRLTLNNMVQDPSMLHEALSYELFRAADVPAPRTGYAFVRLNGEAYGVYLDVETLDSVSLPRWFPSTRHLYEGTFQVDVRDDALGGFEVDEGDPGDRSDLQALSTAAGAPAFTPAMSAVADLDELTRMWAVEHWIGHWDGYSGLAVPNNYFLHSDATGRFTMLPWGTDQTWARRDPFGAGTARLFVACVQEDACRARYRAALDLVRERRAGLDLGGRIDAIAALLAPWQQSDPRREQSLDDITEAVADARAFLAARPGDLAAWLAAEQPAQPPEPPAPGDDDAPPAPAILAVPGPAPAPAPALPPAPAPRAALLALGPTRVSRTTLTTTVRVPGTGLVTQRATVRAGARTIALCAARARAATAGTVVVRCRLGRAADRLRAGAAVRATLTTRFTPAAGPPQVLTRPLVLGRAAARPRGR